MIPSTVRSNANGGLHVRTYDGCCRQIRNKHLSKRDTEKSIKEIWKARLEDQKGGQTSELPDFIYQHWQKKVGIAAAVVEVRFSAASHASCSRQAVPAGLVQLRS